MRDCTNSFSLTTYSVMNLLDCDQSEIEAKGKYSFTLEIKKINAILGKQRGILLLRGKPDTTFYVWLFLVEFITE